MCVAALVKPGATVSDDNMRRMFNSNQDGAGIAYVKHVGGKLDVVIDKGYFDSEQWIEAFKRAKDLKVKDSPILLHARIATMGRIDKANCHPFRIKDGAMIHNGSLWHSRNGYSMSFEKSDTREFAERCTNNFNYEDMMYDLEALENVIGHNRMAFLFKDCRYIILNEKKGRWENDVWFSNSHFCNSSAASCRSRQYRST